MTAMALTSSTVKVHIFSTIYLIKSFAQVFHHDLPQTTYQALVINDVTIFDGTFLLRKALGRAVRPYTGQ